VAVPRIGGTGIAEADQKLHGALADLVVGCFGRDFGGFGFGCGISLALIALER
jgi:hypothetical protein